MKSTKITVAEYLLTRLKEIGVDHLFGVPGDFVLGFFNQVLKSDLKYVGACNELNAAYAADGYARIRGIGAFSTTYGVGELSAVNGVAGAFAERVPVVVITGSPATINFRTRPLLHHTLGDYQIPLRIYEKITVASTQLDSAETAPAEIDRVLTECLSHQLPVYISLPSDVVMMKCNRPNAFTFPTPAPSDRHALGEAIREALVMLNNALKPVVIGDVELIRFKLQKEFAAFLDKTGLPYVTMMLGKTVLSERHPQFIGLFEGDRSRSYVRNRVESADCVLQLGTLMTDLNTGGFTTNLDDSKTISANIRSVKIKHHYYENVYLPDFILGLTEKLSRRDPATLDIQAAVDGCVHRHTQQYRPDTPKPLTIKRFFDRMSHFIKNNSIVIAETGVSLFSAAEMLMPEGATFIGQTFYGSIGYTVGATLGAGMAAQDRPAVLFVGDGSFQVTCQDLSTMIRNHLKPVIFLINNDGYTIERVISDHSYNDIQPWNYHKLVDVFGSGLGLDVRTEGELEDALEKAATTDGLVFIEIHTGRLDCPESLRSAGRSMAKASQLDLCDNSELKRNSKNERTFMLNKAKTLRGYKLDGLDGEIGKVKEFYFDDQHWTIRYLVADSGNWLTDRQVLISPYALVAVNKEEQNIEINLTKKQIEDSPSLDSDKPVSRQFEDTYYGFYGWPMYWGGPYMWGNYPFIVHDPEKWKEYTQAEKTWDPFLRSTHDVTGNHIQAADGEIGHVEDFIIDDETWAIRYLIIDTRNWWPGKKVLLSPQWIERVSWLESKVFVNLSRETIKQSPEYTEESLLTRDYEIALHRHYNRQGYWADEPAAKEHSR